MELKKSLRDWVGCHLKIEPLQVKGSTTHRKAELRSPLALPQLSPWCTPAASMIHCATWVPGPQILPIALQASCSERVELSVASSC